MKLLALSGFLGSCKTTLLLQVARHLTDSGLKVAIIENEASRVGMDDKLVAAAGFEVRELYAGCICCSLRVGLVSTLFALEKEVNPDVVILEPSGIAAPYAIKEAFSDYSGAPETVLMVVLADVPRMEKLAGRSLPFFDASVEAGEILALTKVDVATDITRPKALADLRRLNATAPIYEISAKTGEGMGAFLAALSEKLALGGKMPVPVRAPGSGPVAHPDAIACAEMAERVSNVPVEVAVLVQDAEALVMGLVADLREKNYDILGHIKVIVEAPGAGLVALSFTGPETRPERKGKLEGQVTRAALRVNAILCGVPQGELAGMLRARVEAWKSAV